MSYPPIAILTISSGRPGSLRGWLEALASAGLRDVLLREPTRTDLNTTIEQALSVGLFPWVHSKNPAAEALAATFNVGIHRPSTALLPSPQPWGASCHSPDELRLAFANGASYAMLSPVFSPNSKVDARVPLGLETFLRWGGPDVLALGGIQAARAHAVQRGGGSGVAVLGDVDVAPSELATRIRSYPSARPLTRRSAR